MTLEPVQHIDNDLECVRCGYNLRGLDADGACPECSVPIAGSLVPNRLLGADQRWLRTVHNGLTLLFMRYVVGVLLILAYAFGWMAEWSRLGVGAAYTTIEGFAFVGTVLLTAANPAAAASAQRRAERAIVCSAALVQLLTVVAQRMGTIAPFDWPAAALSGAISLSASAATVGQFVYVRRLALTAGEARMARETMFVMSGYMAPFLFMCLYGVMVAGSPGVVSWPLIYESLWVAMGALTLFIVWNVVLLLRYRKLLAAAFAVEDGDPTTGD